MTRDLSAEAQAMMALDVQKTIKAVLVSPMRSTGEIREADGKISLEELSASNTTVMTRLIMQMSYNATKGDVKSAQFLFDYAGFKGDSPVDDDTIVFVDDIANPVSASPMGEIQDAEFKVLASGDGAPEEKDDDEIELIDDL